MNRGMTLVEIIVSMFLLGIMAAGVFSTFSMVGAGFGQSGANELRGANYARETLELLYDCVSSDTAGRGAHLVDSNASGPTEYPVTDLGITLPEGWGGNYYVDDIDENGDNSTDYKKVKVNIWWPD
ncbi:MAG: prepilin-type N-terminal cleavage/methylation domain-containing protein [Candidatus Omnitrophota bacterium]